MGKEAYRKEIIYKNAKRKLKPWSSEGDKNKVTKLKSEYELQELIDKTEEDKEANSFLSKGRFYAD